MAERNWRDTWEQRQTQLAELMRTYCLDEDMGCTAYWITRAEERSDDFSRIFDFFSTSDTVKLVRQFIAEGIRSARVAYISSGHNRSMREFVMRDLAHGRVGTVITNISCNLVENYEHKSRESLHKEFMALLEERRKDEIETRGMTHEQERQFLREKYPEDYRL